MFSGIIDQIGVVRRVADRSNVRTLTIEAPDYWQDLPAGASVAIDGVCLTMTSADRRSASFDVIAETLRRSTLGDLRDNSRVNLQKSMAVGDRIDGHFVQGHVDAIAKVVAVEQSGGEAIRWFKPDVEAMRCIVPKGSVTIDGISLTVANVKPDRFSVALIPTTLERTTLKKKNVGASVNVETDILVRSLAHLLDRMKNDPESTSVTADLLRRVGFDATES